MERTPGRRRSSSARTRRARPRLGRVRRGRRRAGAVAPRGMRNPAGSLYIGGAATERGLTEIDVAAQSCGTVCSILRTRMCCRAIRAFCAGTPDGVMETVPGGFAATCPLGLCGGGRAAPVSAVAWMGADRERACGRRRFMVTPLVGGGGAARPGARWWWGPVGRGPGWRR
ncbi:DUF6229 family protein [Embleya sp. NPDC056575]|uniref:DUF6229 family protein n=1 Tax=unclassified Embleya TaxID=2699296 RepID=UPI0036A387F0